jgi:hypothetical protein
MVIFQSHYYNDSHQQIESLKVQNAKLLKEHEQAMRKCEEKLTHNESTVRSLVKDNVSLQNQISIQHKEYRSASQRETALRTAVCLAVCLIHLINTLLS